MSDVQTLEQWMRGTEGENLEFKAARNRYDFEELTRMKPHEFCPVLSPQPQREAAARTTANSQVASSKWFTDTLFCPVLAERLRLGSCGNRRMTVYDPNPRPPETAPECTRNISPVATTIVAHAL
jgi:hypothetical protein